MDTKSNAITSSGEIGSGISNQSDGLVPDSRIKATLVVSRNCPPCFQAKRIITKLIAEGYSVKIENIIKHPNIRSTPTLIVKGVEYIGLKSEHEYRRLIPKCPSNKRNNDYNF